jgi:hypothetical protein
MKVQGVGYASYDGTGKRMKVRKSSNRGREKRMKVREVGLTIQILAQGKE